QAREVLDRYGLRGCGGRLGPVESLGFFARAHDVPIAQLLAEVRGSANSVGGAPAHPVESADTIYRPFFKAGIAVVLTLGAVWGAYLLFRIGLSRSFTAIGVHAVNAHGHAQIFGWVGLFVMGFACQAFPRFKHTTLFHPRLAYANLGLMVAGIVIRSVSEPLVHVPGAATIAVGASVLEVVAVVLFVWVIIRTLGGSAMQWEPYDYYILSALGWFVLQAVYETVYLAATVSVTDEKLVPLVATWQGALREIQIHGFALLMILGVSQRVFHSFYDLPSPSRRVSVAALWCVNAAVVGEAAGLILMRKVGHAWA